MKNLTVSGNVSGATNNSVGGVVGQNDDGIIENCTFEGSIRGTTNCFAGGVVGGNNGGTVKNCFNAGTVSGTDTSAGGVVGENSGTVENCSNAGEVSGDDNPAGGVVGENSGTVENCSNTGKVSGTGSIQAPAGGVVGENRGTVENCSNTGTVSGSNNAGGVVGENRESGTVENCYNTGKVSGEGSVGGVVGENSSGIGTVTNCYNTGTVSGKGSVGGVAGENNGTVANCYYQQSEGAPTKGIGAANGTVSKVESKTPTQFASGEVAWLLQDGQDSDIWGQRLAEEADPYPVLTAFNPDAPQVYRVTFAGGEDVPDQYVNENCTVTKPEIQNKEDFTLGWYSDSEHTTRWDFKNDTVRQDMTLHAKWLSSDTNVKSVTVSGTEATPGENNTFTVTLPAGSSLPTNAGEITIEPAEYATVSTPTSTNDGATWTFTVTAEDGTTTANYTLHVSVQDPAPDPEPEPDPRDARQPAGTALRRRLLEPDVPAGHR